MQEVSRRAVLSAGAAALGLAVAGAAVPAGAAAPTRVPVPLRSHYTKFVGRQYLAVQGSTRRLVRLVAVEDLHPTTKAQRPYCFNLIFVPVNGRHLPEGIYRLHRTGTHPSELFLSAAGSGVRMQAVVNRAPVT